MYLCCLLPLCDILSYCHGAIYPFVLKVPLNPSKQTSKQIYYYYYYYYSVCLSVCMCVCARVCVCRCKQVWIQARWWSPNTPWTHCSDLTSNWCVLSQPISQYTSSTINRCSSHWCCNLWLRFFSVVSALHPAVLQCFFPIYENENENDDKTIKKLKR